MLDGSSQAIINLNTLSIAIDTNGLKPETTDICPTARGDQYSGGRQAPDED